MKISELKTIAKENDYELKEEKEIEQITLERKVTFDGFISNVITISLIKKNLIFIKSKHCDNKDFNMIKAAIEFAETPIEDREEKKKFYLKHRYFEIAGGGRGFFTIDNDSGLPFLSYKTSSDNYNQIFTLKEIDEIKEKFNTDLGDFKRSEVEE